ncbi:MAG: DUF2147 domain-containing protein [Rudaea sp.]
MRSAYFLLAAAAAMLAGSAAAAEMSPVGIWTTYTDDNSKAQSHVEIFENNGTLSGKVIEIMYSDKGPNPICDLCEGARHNQPITGMTIMQDFKKTGDDLWEGGTIVKPKNGKVYKCKLHLIDGGKKLEVRGFIGFALLGETHIWDRAAP